MLAFVAQEVGPTGVTVQEVRGVMWHPGQNCRDAGTGVKSSFKNIEQINPEERHLATFVLRHYW